MTPLADQKNRAAEKAKLAEDVERLLKAEGMPCSIAEAKSHLKCGQPAAKSALDEARQRLDAAA